MVQRDPLASESVGHDFGHCSMAIHVGVDFVAHAEHPGEQVFFLEGRRFGEAIGHEQILFLGQLPHSLGELGQFRHGTAGVFIDGIRSAKNDGCSGGVGAADDGGEVGDKVVQRQAGDIVHAEHHHHQVRLPGDDVLFHPREARGGGVAADPGVYHFQPSLRKDSLYGQPEHVAPGPLSAGVVVGTGNAVAKADDAGRLARGEAFENGIHGRRLVLRLRSGVEGREGDEQ